VTRWNRRLLLGAAALLVPVLVGCEAGLNAPTLLFHPAANGTSTTVNGLSIDNVFVLGPTKNATLPAGGRAGVFLALYSQSADKLTSISAPGTAKTVKITGGTVSLAPNTLVDLQGPAPSVELNGLTKPLSGGETVTLVLNFVSAGAVTLNVPVEPRTDYYSTYSPPAVPSPRTKLRKAHPSASGSATATPAASASPSASPSAAS
jgi:copper(I)-binding protein